MKKSDLNKKYIWQHIDWPHFHWNTDLLLEPMNKLSRLQGELQGKMSILGFNNKSQTLLSTLTDELVSSSGIEGISLNPQSVRSSLARRLGMGEEGVVVEDRYIEGLVEVMIDATLNSSSPLSDERLLGWHAALFPTGRSTMYKITVADWRKGDSPMQVVSGAFGHEKVHYEAIPSAAVPLEMKEFIEWCNTSTLHPIVMSAVAHLWFVTIHPFDDGNGRIGRTIADMFLSRMEGENTKYYSMSAEINRHKKTYYEILEKTQKGDMDITDWLLWYLDCLEKAVVRAHDTVENTVQKALYWDRFQNVMINDRQRKVINRLWDGFDGKLTSSKWAKICHCSQDTAWRDINDLISKGMMRASSEGGRSTNYLLTK